VIRKAFYSQVQPGKIDEYTRRHNPIWQELYDVLKSHGIHSFTIFFHEPTLTLFSYVEIEDDNKLSELAQNEVCRRWWKDMTNYLVSDTPNADKAREEPLKEICRIE